MGFNTGLGFPIMLGRPYYYMEEGFVPPTGSACSCSTLHACEQSQIFGATTNTHISQQCVGQCTTCNFTHTATGGTTCGVDGADLARTWCVWIKTADITSKTLFSKGTTILSDQREYICFFDSSDKLTFRIYDDLCSVGDNYIQQLADSASTSDIQDGEWHQVIIIYAGTAVHGGITMYIDGALVTSTGSEVNTYGYTTSRSQPLIFGKDTMASSGGALGGNFGLGSMAHMAMWDTNISAATVPDLWNSGNSYIYQVNPITSWSGVSDLSYSTHYTDGGTGTDYCENLIFYLPGCANNTAAATEMEDFGCGACDFYVLGTPNIDSDNWPGMYTPNVSVTGVTEKIRIWLQNNDSGLTTSLWPNSATGDTDNDAKQLGGAGLKAATSNDGTSFGLDFDGSSDHYDFRDASNNSYDFDIATQEGLTIMCVFNRDADADHTIMSSGNSAHYIQVDSGSDNITIKLGATETTVTPILQNMWTNGTKVLMTLVREAGTTGNINLYTGNMLLGQASQATNTGDGEFNTLGVRGGGTNNYFDGKIYELAMWNKQLSDAERIEAQAFFQKRHGI